MDHKLTPWLEMFCGARPQISDALKRLDATVISKGLLKLKDVCCSRVADPDYKYLCVDKIEFSLNSVTYAVSSTRTDEGYRNLVAPVTVTHGAGTPSVFLAAQVAYYTRLVTMLWQVGVKDADEHWDKFPVFTRRDLEDAGNSLKSCGVDPIGKYILCTPPARDMRFSVIHPWEDA